ncbi:MAG TPA: acylglycerol kinase family protein, partial [Ktedonobacteraceae bacterium]
MKQKQASLIINPRAGQNLAKVTDILAVLAAAGWKTDLDLKEYGGHTMTLATRAAENGQDLVIAYGGDGTLNQVVNGVMHAPKQESVVGLIPGGTANVWASEIGIPTDPVKAALTLIDSQARCVDVGHVEVDGLNLADADQDERSRSGKRGRKKQAKAATQVRQHFLLMAGLGIDAAIMGHVSKPLKY